MSKIIYGTMIFLKMTNLNFIRETETKDFLKNCNENLMTPQDILDYLYKYNNMDSKYIYENLTDLIQKEVDKLIIQKLINDQQLMKEKQDFILKLNKRIQILDNEMDNFEPYGTDYNKLSYVSTSLFDLRLKTYSDLSLVLQTHSTFGPYKIDHEGNVKFDDNFDNIELSLLSLKQRFRKLTNLIDDHQNDEFKVKEIIKHRNVINDLENEIKTLDDIIKKLDEKFTKQRELELDNYKISKELVNEVGKMCELKDKLFKLENNQPTFGKDHINFILHDFESLKNRLRKMKNFYPWSEFSNYEVFDDINSQINQLQKDLGF